MAKTGHTVAKCHKRVLTILTQQGVRKSFPPKGTTSVIGPVWQTIERNNTGIFKRYMPPIHWGNWVTPQKYVEIKGQLAATDGSLLHNLFFAQHVSGTIMPIIRSSRVLYRWLLPVALGAFVYRLSVWCVAVGYVSGLRDAASTTGSNHLYNTLEPLMMGIMVPETCWANNKFCNKEPSVASSWPFYFHVLTTMHGQTHIKF
jgi:hypothetical protein